jgi:hypothetical protein
MTSVVNSNRADGPVIMIAEGFSTVRKMTRCYIFWMLSYWKASMVDNILISIKVSDKNSQCNRMFLTFINIIN